MARGARESYLPGLRAPQSAHWAFPGTVLISSCSVRSLRACWRLFRADAMVLREEERAATESRWPWRHCGREQLAPNSGGRRGHTRGGSVLGSWPARGSLLSSLGSYRPWVRSMARGSGRARKGEGRRRHTSRCAISRCREGAHLTHDSLSMRLVLVLGSPDSGHEQGRCTQRALLSVVPGPRVRFKWLGLHVYEPLPAHELPRACGELNMVCLTTARQAILNERR